ncbi:MAG: hypothetical protein EXR11_06415 [Rhodospirillaceae bacterium]|nr:hypothetical protein [Rhodospirillaceae bacterium]
MVSSPTKSAKTAKHKTGILGVHPLLAAVAAMALMFAGAVFGAWLNMAKREQAVVQAAKLAPPAAVAKPRTAPPSFTPPVIANMDELDTEPPAIAGPPPPPNLAEQVAKAQAAPPLADPLHAFALPFSAPANRILIAIVIDDMGLDRVHSQRAVELPGPLTLSFLTYANNLSTWAAVARDAGHEVLVDRF